MKYIVMEIIERKNAEQMEANIIETLMQPNVSLSMNSLQPIDIEVIDLTVHNSCLRLVAALRNLYQIQFLIWGLV